MLLIDDKGPQFAVLYSLYREAEPFLDHQVTKREGAGMPVRSPAWVCQLAWADISQQLKHQFYDASSMQQSGTMIRSSGQNCFLITLHPAQAFERPLVEGDHHRDNIPPTDLAR